MSHPFCYTLEEVLEREAQDEKWIRKIGKFTLPERNPIAMSEPLKIEVSGVEQDPSDVERLLFTHRRIVRQYGQGGPLSEGISDEDRQMLLGARRWLGICGEIFDA